MDNNYFARKILDDEKKEYVGNALYYDNYFDVINTIERFSPEIHICKTSSSKKCLWDGNNGRYYDLNKESLQNFLNDKVIYDEKGVIYDSDIFIDKMIKDDSELYEGKKKLDGKSYAEKYPDEYAYYFRESEKIINEKEYKFVYGDYYDEFGLRWSQTPNFR